MALTLSFYVKGYPCSVDSHNQSAYVCARIAEIQLIENETSSGYESDDAFGFSASAKIISNYYLYSISTCCFIIYSKYL
ncbi:GSCOCG00000603001-RA-CDS [Cotesia congregata]|nr:GSCOCG00000603001-RA-CDS [Cotesia congregata]